MVLKHQRWQKGFSLVELSIILVILGLLVTGVLAGSRLIEQAELRTIATEIDRHITSAKTFYDKYGYYPGDIPNASDFWFDTTNCPNGMVPTGCNGNGNQRIADNLVGTAEYDEKYRAWQHLVFAGMMEGNFTGLRIPSSIDGGDSTNSPTSVRSGGLYYMLWDSFYDYFKSPVNMLCFGSIDPGHTPAGPIWSPREAYQFDNKLDDGLPYAGRMMSNEVPVGGSNCVVTATTSTYNLSSESISCRSCFDFDMVKIKGE